MSFTLFELRLGLRYLRARQKNSFVSFISLVSVIGIALGVAALITVLSVMNGFQREIRNKIIGASAHMQLVGASGSMANWRAIANIAMANPQVVGYAPYIDGQALVSFAGAVNGVLVRGVDVGLEGRVDEIMHHMIMGDATSLAAGRFNILIGYELSRQLGVRIGDKIVLMTPNGQVTPALMIPRIKQFTVSGVFNMHMYEYDSSLVLIDLHDAATLFKFGNDVSGIRLKVADIMRTATTKQHLKKVLPDDVSISDWIDQHANYFAAVQLEKKMMFVILALIVAVAAFNLVATLVMTVNDKRADIAILRTMGASKRNIRHIFMLQGGIAGVIGTVCGAICGLLLARYIGYIIHTIEVVLRLQIINSNVYFIDYLPSQIVTTDVLSVVVVSLVLSLLATIYPSYTAASTNPVEVLRYE